MKLCGRYVLSLLSFLIFLFSGFTLISAEKVGGNFSDYFSLYAFNEKCEPVPGLSANDIELYVNGKNIASKKGDSPFFTLNTPTPHEHFGKITIIVIDNTISPAEIYSASENIVKNILRNGKESDRFIIYTFNPLEGLVKTTDIKKKNYDPKSLLLQSAPKPEKWSEMLFGKEKKKDDDSKGIRTVRDTIYGINNNSGKGIDPLYIKKLQKKYSESLKAFEEDLKKIGDDSISFLISGAADKNIFYDPLDKFDLEKTKNLFEKSSIGVKKNRSIWKMLYDRESEGGFATLFSIDMIRYLNTIVEKLVQSGSIFFRIGNIPAGPVQKNDSEKIKKLRLNDPALSIGKKLKNVPLGAVNLVNILTSQKYILKFKSGKDHQKMSIVKLRCKKRGVFLLYPRYFPGVKSSEN